MTNKINVEKDLTFINDVAGRMLQRNKQRDDAGESRIHFPALDVLALEQIKSLAKKRTELSLMLLADPNAAFDMIGTMMMGIGALAYEVGVAAQRTGNHLKACTDCDEG